MSFWLKNFADFEIFRLTFGKILVKIRGSSWDCMRLTHAWPIHVKIDWKS